MFEIGFEWWRGLAQIAVYSGVVLVILWILSKIELPDRGESPIERERESK
jgi:glucose dehydrogenase